MEYYKPTNSINCLIKTTTYNWQMKTGLLSKTNAETTDKNRSLEINNAVCKLCGAFCCSFPYF